MSKTLLVESNEEVKRLLYLNLDIFLGTEIIVRENSEEVLSILQVVPEIDLIVTQNRGTEDDDETAKIIYKFIKEKKLSTAILVVGKTGDPVVDEYSVERPDKGNWQDIIKKAATLLGITAKDAANKHVPDLYPIDIAFFIEITSVPCSVYIKLMGGINKQRFVKRLNKNDSFDAITIRKYKDQGVNFLYVPKDFRVEISGEISKNLVAKLKSTSLSNEGRIQATEKAFGLAYDLLDSLGFNFQEDTIELVDTVIDSMQKNALKNADSGLSKLMTLLIKDSEGYRFTHSQLIAVIASTVIKNSSWGNHEQQNKICFVSFFHDITLVRDEYAQVRSMRDLTAYRKDPQLVKKIERHALEVSKLISHYPDSPMGVDVIAKQHHGSITGVGFPDRIDSQISPLARTFFAVEEFVDAVLDPATFQQNKSVKDVVMELDKKHQKRNSLSKIFQVIKDNVKD